MKPVTSAAIQDMNTLPRTMAIKTLIIWMVAWVVVCSLAALRYVNTQPREYNCYVACGEPVVYPRLNYTLSLSNLNDQVGTVTINDCMTFPSCSTSARDPMLYEYHYH